jgi:uncharacterized membrane protein
MSSKKPADHDNLFDAELFISASLRYGVYVSATIVALGIVLLLVRGTSGYPAGVFPTTIPSLVAGLIQFKTAAIISLGLLLLIATPVFRVAASVLLFLLEKDHLYTVITLFVLAVLISSFLLGKAL